MTAYNLEDLTGFYTQTHERGEKLETPRQEPWHDESEMIAHMLLGGVLWTRSAHYVGNKDTPYEFSGQGIIVLMNCNDVFAWGCSDTQELPHDKVPELFMLWHESNKWGPIKWCCIQRNEKPQGPVARDMKADGFWCDLMEALPENKYDKICRERALAKAAAWPLPSTAPALQDRIQHGHPPTHARTGADPLRRPTLLR